MSSELLLPNAIEIKSLMNTLTEDLYNSWKREMSSRLNNLILHGKIYILNLDCSDINCTVSRLPNNYLRIALGKLENDLQQAGFETQFKFDHVEEENWSLNYEIEFPDP